MYTRMTTKSNQNDQYKSFSGVCDLITSDLTTGVGLASHSKDTRRLTLQKYSTSYTHKGKFL